MKIVLHFKVHLCTFCRSNDWISPDINSVSSVTVEICLKFSSSIVNVSCICHVLYHLYLNTCSRSANVGEFLFVLRPLLSCRYREIHKITLPHLIWHLLNTHMHRVTRMGEHGGTVPLPLQLSFHQSLSGESGNRTANLPVIGRPTLTTAEWGWMIDAIFEHFQNTCLSIIKTEIERLFYPVKGSIKHSPTRGNIDLRKSSRKTEKHWWLLENSRYIFVLFLFCLYCFFCFCLNHLWGKELLKDAVKLSCLFSFCPNLKMAGSTISKHGNNSFPLHKFILPWEV